SKPSPEIQYLESAAPFTDAHWTRRIIIKRTRRPGEKWTLVRQFFPFLICNMGVRLRIKSRWQRNSQPCNECVQLSSCRIGRIRCRHYAPASNLPASAGAPADDLAPLLFDFLPRVGAWAKS